MNEGLYISPKSETKQLIIDVCEFFIEKKVVGEIVFMRQLFTDFDLSHDQFTTMFTYGLIRVDPKYMQSYYSQHIDLYSEDLRRKYLFQYGTLRISSKNASVQGTELLSIVYNNLLNGRASHVSNDVVETLDFV